MVKLRSVVLLVAVLMFRDGARAFMPLLSLSGNSSTHQDITRRAVLWKTAEVCRDMAAADGRPFSLTIDSSLTVEKVQAACAGNSTAVLSTVTYQSAIAAMYFSNALVDVVYALSEEHHFDDELFKGGREVLTKDVAAVKSSVKEENFIAGRFALGRACHTLQDFYSHSNWVELGKTSPYSALIIPEQNLENLAGTSVRTCQNCTNGDCTNNILPDVLQQGLLTSGYFNIFSSEKPAGKCSHGGSFDKTRTSDATGGISKDTLTSSHGSLHPQAATLAVNATVELLEDIRLAVGDKDFLRLMGLSQSTVLCFVIDTTGSMSDDIAEAKRVSFEIIDRKRGTQQEPSAYILVPFNDPGFGPLVRTTDADKFKAEINKLSASGGGDIPEKCLSGLQLALTAAPPSSEIFIFTDAPAKDADLKSTINALIESTKSVVTFMLTDVISRRRRSGESRAPRAMSQADAQLYRDLAKASGGQAIEVTKSDLSAATTVIEDSSTSAVVNVFQVVSPGKPEKFNFTVDGSIQNMTLYVTGTTSLTFNLSSPSGVSQSSTETSGPLASMTTAGNLRRLSFNADNQTGLWEIEVNSNDPYSVKVIGQSSVNFIYNLIEPHEGAHGDYSLKEGRPLTGGNATVLVTVTSDAVKITEITLFDSAGPTELKGTMLPQSDGNIVVTFSNIPAGDFVLRIKGEGSATSRATPTSFQRQASTQLKPSSISVTAQVNSSSIEPGSSLSVPFTVASTSNGAVNQNASGTITVKAQDDRGYTSSPTTSVTLSQGTASSVVTLAVPSTAATGTDVTLTITAQDSSASDINFTVLRFSVAAKVTDVKRPVCEVVTSGDCSSSVCSSAQWGLSANISDGVNGTGIDSVALKQGTGTLNISTTASGGETITVATYTASCCSKSVELKIVDKVGNVRLCSGEFKVATTAAPAVTNTTTNSTAAGLHTVSVRHSLWVSLLLPVVWWY
ncbi:unnamed protein product [Knipowitschia caucasica]|uniref:von Willebrand factor A domain-containing protein 7-like n=1 Tax=Knipowitschia caucasica TaxID=637954 RepID=A0AAV2LQQ3_KNICA